MLFVFVVLLFISLPTDVQAGQEQANYNEYCRLLRDQAPRVTRDGSLVKLSYSFSRAQDTFDIGPVRVPRRNQDCIQAKSESGPYVSSREIIFRGKSYSLLPKEESGNKKKKMPPGRVTP